MIERNVFIIPESLEEDSTNYALNPIPEDEQGRCEIAVPPDGNDGFYALALGFIEEVKKGRMGLSNEGIEILADYISRARPVIEAQIELIHYAPLELDHHWIDEDEKFKYKLPSDISTDVRKAMAPIVDNRSEASLDEINIHVQPELLEPLYNIHSIIQYLSQSDVDKAFLLKGLIDNSNSREEIAALAYALAIAFRQIAAANPALEGDIRPLDAGLEYMDVDDSAMATSREDDREPPRLLADGMPASSDELAYTANQLGLSLRIYQPEQAAPREDILEVESGKAAPLIEIIERGYHYRYITNNVDDAHPFCHFPYSDDVEDYKVIRSEKVAIEADDLCDDPDVSAYQMLLREQTAVLQTIDYRQLVENFTPAKKHWATGFIAKLDADISHLNDNVRPRLSSGAKASPSKTRSVTRDVRNLRHQMQKTQKQLTRIITETAVVENERDLDSRIEHFGVAFTQTRHNEVQLDQRALARQPVSSNKITTACLEVFEKELQYTDLETEKLSIETNKIDLLIMTLCYSKFIKLPADNLNLHFTGSMKKLSREQRNIVNLLHDAKGDPSGVYDLMKKPSSSRGFFSAQPNVMREHYEALKKQLYDQKHEQALTRALDHRMKVAHLFESPEGENLLERSFPDIPVR